MKIRRKHPVRVNHLGSDPIPQLVRRLALPAMLAQFVNVLYSIIDRMYIGNIANVGDIALAGVNPSCGDNIVLKLKTDGDVITDGGFVGDGCAISQASADIMLGMIVGQKKEKALEMGRTFLRMIHGEATEEEIESLEEASALKDIAHMPARVKCAMLGWRTLSEALTGKVEE